MSQPKVVVLDLEAYAKFNRRAFALLPAHISALVVGASSTHCPEGAVEIIERPQLVDAAPAYTYTNNRAGAVAVLLVDPAAMPAVEDDGSFYERFDEAVEASMDISPAFTTLQDVFADSSENMYGYKGRVMTVVAVLQAGETLRFMPDEALTVEGLKLNGQVVNHSHAQTGATCFTIPEAA